ncbi:DUF3955 domain-containing protein [Lacticaseibacillus daqingensis]|uniref:DUF3955 domain-containing protein n=1 Tax=Lacticaseibacillus daqingensis TaxID=2486014 RepID=UPI000F78E60E|nr:DUF3955 domain-containing protein [Lacticaseibacillus daqingensis]
MKYRYPLALVGLAIALPLIGAQFSTMAADGTLHEPFFFTIPLGYALIAIAAGWAGRIAWLRHRQH